MINLKDTVQKPQPLDLKNAFKQEKAESCNAINT